MFQSNSSELGMMKSRGVQHLRTTQITLQKQEIYAHYGSSRGLKKEQLGIQASLKTEMDEKNELYDEPMLKIQSKTHFQEIRLLPKLQASKN